MAAFTVIDHTEIGTGGAAVWSETGISGSYDHLLLIASIRSEQPSIDYDIIDMRFNGITSSVYTTTDLAANSATPTSTTTTARGDFNGAVWPGGVSTADTFGCLKIWIPHYANSTNFKQVFMSSTSGPASASNTDWALRVVAGLWAQPAAVTQIDIRSGYAADHAEFSTFTLYGITGA